ncbi:hypothetical protein BC835DRAFT_693306 [Cytidiella melzeri]|nr:hypothetical protein BC835DRAFT_693306 [Cytidiella melzeri]
MTQLPSRGLEPQTFQAARVALGRDLSGTMEDMETGGLYDGSSHSHFRKLRTCAVHIQSSGLYRHDRVTSEHGECCILNCAIAKSTASTEPRTHVVALATKNLLTFDTSPPSDVEVIFAGSSSPKRSSCSSLQASIQKSISGQHFDPNTCLSVGCTEGINVPRFELVLIVAYSIRN